jgi:hypothetical protein
MSGGIASLTRDTRGPAVTYILAGGAVLFFLLLAVTVLAFHRPVTSELLIIHIWAVLELSAAAALYGAGRFGPVRAAFIASLAGIATVTALICYVLYYRLDEIAGYRAGMVPLAADAVVMGIFLMTMAVSADQ